jgi:hypothetical protein
MNLRLVVLSQCNSDNVGSNCSVSEIMNFSPTPYIADKIRPTITTNIKNIEVSLLDIVIATKKILVIVLMAVLASSVAAGASSLFTGTPSTRVEEQDINTQLNSVVEFCIQSLPDGLPECDSQLSEMVANTCKDNNNNLDACRNDKVNQYYRTRSTG